MLIYKLFVMLRYDDQFVVAAFDSAPSADSEVHSKLDQTSCPKLALEPVPTSKLKNLEKVETLPTFTNILIILSGALALNLICHDPFQAIMKSYVAMGSDTDKSFLAYMVAYLDEVDIALHLLLKYIKKVV